MAYTGPLLRCVCARDLFVCLGAAAETTQWRASWHAQVHFCTGLFVCLEVGAETTTQEKARWHAQVHFCAVFVLVICLSAWVLLLRLCSRFVCLLGCWTCCLPPRAALSSPSRNTSADNQSCLLDCIAALALQHACSFHS